MMTVELPEFIRRIVESSVMNAAEVQAFINGLPDKDKPQDSSQLAQALVRAGRLTPYQAQAIYLGKGSQLTIGNYILLGKLGKGGMGVVYKAVHRRMNRLVAIKTLTPTAMKLPPLVKRFRREVRAVAQLEHPNIVTAYDADEAGGRQFLVMQFVDGMDLGSMVKQKGPLPETMALSCILQTARGLEYAHGRGVVHRDVKPANLLLARDGTVKILDMGLARLDQELCGLDDPTLTDTGIVMGSVDYMAPEQAASMRKSDARSDIYSLGYTLWFLLTGREPYQGDSPIERLVAHWERPLPSLLEACPGIPPRLEAIFHKMVAKKPDDRYQTMTELITDLERYRTAEAAAARHVPADPAKKEDEDLREFLQVLSQHQTDAENACERRRSGRERTNFPAPDSPPLGKTGRIAQTHRTKALHGKPSGKWKFALWISLSGVLAAAALVAVFGLPLGRPERVTTGPPVPTYVKPPVGMPGPPQRDGNAVNLLDERLSNWQPQKEPKVWRVQKEGEDCVLTVERGQANWLVTKAEYLNYALWLEYRLYGGAESGLLLRTDPTKMAGDRAQVQIAAETSRDHCTGAIVGALVRPAEGNPQDWSTPDANWHALVVEFQGAAVRVWIDDRHVNVAEFDPFMVAPLKFVGLEGSDKRVDFRRIFIQPHSSEKDPPTAKR